MLRQSAVCAGFLPVERHGGRERKPCSDSFANLVISSSKRGMAADEKGNFVLREGMNERKSVLSISSVGYLGREMSLDSFWKKSNVMNELAGDARLLNEVGEARIDPKAIIEKAIQSVPPNYQTAPC